MQERNIPLIGMTWPGFALLDIVKATEIIGKIDAAIDRRERLLRHWQRIARWHLDPGKLRRAGFFQTALVPS